MTLKLSAQFVDDFLEDISIVKGAYAGTDITFVDGGGSDDTITRSSGSWVTDGFEVGDIVSVLHANTAANDGNYRILAVSATTLNIATGSIDTGESGVAATIVAVAKGAGIRELLQKGYIKIYSGSQPADADTSETGTELVKITDNGGTHDTGTGANGLDFEDATGKVLSKLSTQVWKGSPSNSGVAGYFRFYDQAGNSMFDGAIALTGGEMQVANTSISVGTDFTINAFDIIVPV